MKKFLLTLLLITGSSYVFSQNFEVPENYSLETEEDFSKYQQDVIDGINWLEKTPVNAISSKKDETIQFLLLWMIGSPDVHIEIKAEIVNFLNTSPDLLIFFLGGWTKYTLETKDSSNKTANSVAGINAVIDFYQKNKDFLTQR